MAEAVINSEALKENLKKFQELSGCEVIAVVKANAYGHGAVDSSRAFLEAGAKMLAVAAVEEAV
ncbi:MAG: hypothetical protein AMS15_09270, partial [Planctomycetes bacterium DG_23]